MRFYFRGNFNLIIMSSIQGLASELDCNHGALIGWHDWKKSLKKSQLNQNQNYSATLSELSGSVAAKKHPALHWTAADRCRLFINCKGVRLRH